MMTDLIQIILNVVDPHNKTYQKSASLARQTGREHWKVLKSHREIMQVYKKWNDDKNSLVIVKVKNRNKFQIVPCN